MLLEATAPTPPSGPGMMESSDCPVPAAALGGASRGVAGESSGPPTPPCTARSGSQNFADMAMVQRITKNSARVKAAACRASAQRQATPSGISSAKQARNETLMRMPVTANSAQSITKTCKVPSCSAPGLDGPLFFGW